MDLSGIVTLLETALLVGLLYSLSTVGLSLSFRILNYPDLTLEGSVIFGGALAFRALKAGLDPWTSLLVGAFAGALAGGFTAVQYLYLRVSKLLSGIITTAVLYSINLRLLGGRANARFESTPSLFDVLNPDGSRRVSILILSAFVLLVIALSTLLFRTKLGMLIRTLGDNEMFVVSLGQNPRALTLTGLVFSNAIIGLGGAVLVQFKNTVDVNMSVGLLIGALAAMVLGEALVAAKSLWEYMLSSVLGTVAYNLAIALVLFSWSSRWDSLVMSSDVRLLTGLLLIVPTALGVRRRGKFRLFRSEW